MNAPDPAAGTSDTAFPTRAGSRAAVQALEEDAADRDFSTEWSVPAGTRAAADIVAKTPGVIAGLPMLDLIYRHLDPGAVDVLPLVAEGACVRPGDVLAQVRGAARTIITGERVVLNFLQRLCGIATLTRSVVEITRPAGVTVLDTRKTAPGLRHLDKYAVVVGGGSNHRLDLSSMVLLKENHLAAGGGLTATVEAVRRRMSAHGTTLQVETEVRDSAEALEAMNAGVDRIMLDNMSPEEIRDVVETRQRLGLAASCSLEASGNITVHNVSDVADTGVEFISLGALTHSVEAMDISLLLREVQAAGPPTAEAPRRVLSGSSGQRAEGGGAPVDG